MPITYPSIGKVIEIHALAMQVSDDVVQGSNPDALALLESALIHMQNDAYYPTIDEKLTHLFFSACKSHAFVEGNKRMALALSVEFLAENCFDAITTQFVRHMEDVVVCVADNKIDKALLGQIIRNFLVGDEEDEGIKLRILDAVEQVRIDQERRDAENQPPPPPGGG